MTSALLMYWSLSGTTRRVAERVAAGLRASGVDTMLHDLRAAPAPDASGFDIVGVGSPTHFYRLPAQVSEALGALGRLDGKSGFAFTLQGSYRGLALNLARRGLTRKGAVDVGSLPLFGEGHFLGYVRQGYLFAPGRPNEADLEKAEAFGRRVAAAHADRQAGRDIAPAQLDPDVGWVYRLERMAAAPWLARSVYSRLFALDRAACTRCGKCARVCPTGNITWAMGELPAWGHDCTLCGTCDEICPADAVTMPLDWALLAPFMRYNVRRAAADQEVGHLRIVHRGGKNLLA